MATQVMTAKCAVLFIFCVINGFYTGEALHKIPDSLLSPWYCQRLVPAFITAAVTPCTYPCLFLSPHEPPRIVVHPEQDGTPCRITTGVGHHYEVGKCRENVCRPTLPHVTLKRKKRFICLYALVKLIKARKQLQQLKEMIKKLEAEAATAGSAGISSVAGPVAGPVAMSPTGSAGGTPLNVDNRGTYIGPAQGSGGLGAVDTSRSPGGSPATLNAGIVGGHTVSAGMRDDLGIGLLGNAGAGSGSLETGIFGFPGNNGRPIESATIGSTISNTGRAGSGFTGLVDNRRGTTGGIGIAANSNGAVETGTGRSNVAGHSRLLGSPHIDSVGLSTSGTSSTGSVLPLNNSNGGRTRTAIAIAASGSGGTTITSPDGNNLARTITTVSSGSNVGVASIRS